MIKPSGNSFSHRSKISSPIGSVKFVAKLVVVGCCVSWLELSVTEISEAFVCLTLVTHHVTAPLPKASLADTPASIAVRKMSLAPNSSCMYNVGLSLLLFNG